MATIPASMYSYLEQQKQQQQQLANALMNQQSLTITAASNSWGDYATTTTPGSWIPVSNTSMPMYGWQQALQGMAIAQPEMKPKVVKFWRVNQVVEIDDGGLLEDPLDNLRLAIARWLRPKEAFNLT